jgi:hypothetical protein
MFQKGCGVDTPANPFWNSWPTMLPVFQDSNSIGNDMSARVL